MRRIVFIMAGFLSLANLAKPAESLEWVHARDLYERTDYAGSLQEALAIQGKDAAVLLLIGQDYFGLAEYKKSSEFLEKALTLEPNSPEISLWLGRAFAMLHLTGLGTAKLTMPEHELARVAAPKR